MLEIPSGLAQYLHYTIALVLLGATWAFIVFHWRPGLRMSARLKAAQQGLRQIEQKLSMTDLDAVRARAMVGDELQHCWDEFRDTLHPQKAVNELGELVVTRWRSTALASTFFTEQALVHSPLRTEFFKHLPGILTGVGIIGTFGGLILGLQAFGSVDLGDPDAARTGLSDLLREVGGAFIMSGGAIFLAMVLTTIEKILVNGLITRVESLCSQIDSRFDAGAGEEYLQRLVEAAETSATQALQMKESLVTDLKQVLTELTNLQIAATQTATTQLGKSISENLNDGLKAPLQNISEAVRSVSTQQGEAVNKLLTDVLSSFSAQMEGLFGRQLAGMGTMLEQTAATMQTASQRIEGLLEQIQTAGNGAAEAMAAQVAQALTAMQVRQEESIRQMQSFLEAIRESAAQGQSQANQAAERTIRELAQTTAQLVEKLQSSGQGAADAMAGRVEQALAQIREAQESTTTQMRDFIETMKQEACDGQAQSSSATEQMIKGLGAATAELLERLQARSDEQSEQHEQRQHVLAGKTASLLEAQAEQVDRLIETVRAAEASMQATVARIQKSTSEHLQQMQEGAGKLFDASDLLGKNLATMKANSDNLVGSAEGLTRASASLNGTVAVFQKALDDHKSVRDAISTAVKDLATAMDTAKREATVTRDLVAGLQQASTRLTEAQQATVSNLEEATEAIALAHGAFAKEVENTLRVGNTVFHKELAAATDLLRGAIEDLGNVLDNLPARS